MVQAFKNAVPASGQVDEEDDLLVLREGGDIGAEGEGEEYTDFLKREAGVEIETFLGEGAIEGDGAEGEKEEKEEKEKKERKKQKKRGEDVEPSPDAKDGGKDNQKKGRKNKDNQDSDFLMKYASFSVTLASSPPIIHALTDLFSLS